MPKSEMLALIISLAALLSAADRFAAEFHRVHSADARVAARPYPAKVTVTWLGKSYAPGELPAAMPVEAARAVRSWQDWADTEDYRMEVEDDGRLVFLIRQSKGKASKELKLIDKTLEILDGMARQEISEASAKAEERVGATTETGKDKEAMVFILTKGDAFESAIKQLVARNLHLTEFAAVAQKTHGFALPDPLVALLRENPQKQSEWEGNLNNEFVSQLAQLDLLSRFGRQPYWVLRGWTWHVELAAMGGIFTFPYKDSFVGIGEHSGWVKELRREFRSSKRKKKPLAIGELAAWQRGTYEEKRAGYSWGMITFLQTYYPDNLGAILREFADERHEKSKVYNTDKTWSIDVNYQLSEEDQLTILQKHTRDDILELATEFFRKGKSFKLPKN